MMDARGNFYYTFPAPEEIFLLTEKSLLVNGACKVAYFGIIPISVADFASSDDEMSIELAAWVKLILGLTL